MSVLLGISRVIDAVTGFIGHHIRWLILAAVLISAGNAVIRKTFDISSNAWLELQWFLFGAVFMLAASYTLQRNGHVRIDVISGRLRQRTRAWIDLFCHILMLLPLCLLMTWLSVPFVVESYQGNEGSPNAGGLIVWPAKFFVLCGFALLLCQALSEIIKRVGHLSGALKEPEPVATHGLTPEDFDVKSGEPK